jgi:hypothetical protein
VFRGQPAMLQKKYGVELEVHNSWGSPLQMLQDERKPVENLKLFYNSQPTNRGIIGVLQYQDCYVMYMDSADSDYNSWNGGTARGRGAVPMKTRSPPHSSNNTCTGLGPVPFESRPESDWVTDFTLHHDWQPRPGPDSPRPAFMPGPPGPGGHGHWHPQAASEDSFQMCSFDTGIVIGWVYPSLPGSVPRRCWPDISRIE